MNLPTAVSFRVYRAGRGKVLIECPIEPGVQFFAESKDLLVWKIRLTENLTDFLNAQHGNVGESWAGGVVPAEVARQGFLTDHIEDSPPPCVAAAVPSLAAHQGRCRPSRRECR